VEKAASMAGLMQTTDPETAAGRDAYIRANPVAAAPPGAPPLGPGLHTGPGDERAGRLSVQSVLPDERRLDDLVGVRFLLAATPDLLEAVAAEVRASVDADPETVVLTDAGLIAPVLAEAGAAAVVVRPDRYVLGTADSPAELEALLRLVPTISVASGAAAPIAAGS
jgi:3-(3-hydroxy-phenyl)propionate hydroxylase